MRTYKEIFVDYCDWVVEKTGREELSYENLLEDTEEKTLKAFLFKEILNKCYEPKNGTYYFIKFVVGDLTNIGLPFPYRYDSLIRKWDLLVKNKKHLAILCARGHGKSAFFSQLLNIYDMFLHRHKRVILVSASQPQANRLLSDLKLIVDTNEWLIVKKDDNRWAAETIGYNGGYIIAKGIGSEIRGEHVDRIVVDDILRSDHKLSDEDIEDYVDMVLEPMILNRRGQMIIVGTPQSPNDIFSTIYKRKRQENSAWEYKRFPSITNMEEKKLLCPHRFTWNDIMQKRFTMGPLKFAREFQLEFFSREQSLFPEHLREPARNKGADLSLLMFGDKRDPRWIFVAGVDVARSGSISADFTVCIVIAFNTITQEKQLVHMWRAKGLKMVEQASKIASISKAFNNCYVLVEQNNMGQDMIDRLVDDHNVNVGTITTTSRSKDEIIRFLIMNFEFEKIIIPQHGEWTREQMNILEDELEKFCETTTPAGNYRYEGVGSHDDTVISLGLAVKATQEVSIPFAVSTGIGNVMGDPYQSLVDSHSDRGETDLMKKIKMGLLK